MGYRELLEHCEGLRLHIRRNAVRDKVLELTAVPQVRVVATGMNHERCRGYYLSARNGKHRLVQQLGTHLIVLARGLPKDWERFVFTKELMHMFSDPLEATDTGGAFEKVLTEFGPRKPGATYSAQMLAEIRCFWMSLAVLCPENHRTYFNTEREAGRIDDYAIAIQLQIPQQYVQHLFRKDWAEIIHDLLGDDSSGD